MQRPHVFILGCALAAIGAAMAAAQTGAERDVPAAPDAIERALVELIARAEPSVVAISRAPAPQRAGVPPRGADRLADLREPVSADATSTIVAAGVLIHRDGLVLTEYLAVHDGDAHTVTTMEGTRYSADVRGADPRSGLAVLKIHAPASPLQRAGQRRTSPGSFPGLPMGDASGLRKGQFVVVIGNPYAIIDDGQPTASWGTVTNLARKAPVGTNLNDAAGRNNDYRTTLHHLGTLIQTDAKLGWSTGGGALVNLEGELIGLTTSVAAIAGHERPAGYAIPLNAMMRRIIETLSQGREVEYGMLGVGFGSPVVDTTPRDSSRLRIAQVYPGTPAARAGLQPGDVITRVGGTQVNDIDAVQLAISALPPSTRITIDYKRDGRGAAATVALAKLAVAGRIIAAAKPAAWRGMRVDYASTLDIDRFAQAVSSGAYDAEGCLLVTEVEPHSAAWRAGVRPGMFISHVGGRRVATPQDFHAAAQSMPADKLDIRLTQPLAPGDP
jgi:serine protease Do